MKRLCLVLLFGFNLVAASISTVAAQGAQDTTDYWRSILDRASGETVYFNTWGGDTSVNRYLDWVATEVARQFQIDLRHVRLADTALAVSRILAEKQSGNDQRGSVDLLWVNGENFATLKDNDLLFGPWAEQLPNFRLVNADRYPEMRIDFTVPVQGLESPWLRAQLVFYYDSDVINDPPRSITALLEWARLHPGEFTYPRPPDFLGTTFLKQALIELNQQDASLYRPVTEDSLARLAKPLWHYLDALHPLLLRKGRYFPASGSQLRRFMADGDTALAFAFSPGEAASGIAAHELPASVRSYVFDTGTISNVSFLAIPYNALNKSAAMVVANFLLSPEAQLRAAQPDQMGSTTVLDLQGLDTQLQQQFKAAANSPAAPSAADLSRRLQEPHPSWMPALEQAWLERYQGL